MRKHDLLRLMTIGGLNASWAQPLVWLFRDEFITDDAAPISSPRTAEPGPGTLTVTDTDNKASISGGALQLAPHSTPAWGDPGVWETGGLARVLGRAVIASATPAATNTWLIFGWDNDQSGFFNTAAMRFFSDGNIDAISRNGSVIGPDVAAYTAATYTCAISLRNAGQYYLIKGQAFTDWTLIWVDDVDVIATLYAAIGTNTATLSVDYLRVTDLPAPFNVDVLHSKLAGNVPVSTTFTHPERCVIEFDLDTLPSGGNIILSFRRVDSDDDWQVRMSSGSTLSLKETVGGVLESRASAPGVLSNGNRIAIFVDGDNISGYYDGTHAWTWPTSITGQSITDGLLVSIGTGGAISDLDIYELGVSTVTHQDATPEESDTFPHDADTRIEFVVEGLPASSRNEYHFRKQDATHYWALWYNINGDYRLYEVNGGSADIRAQSAGAISDGSTIVTEAIGSTITSWVNGVQKWTYSSASNFATAVEGEINQYISPATISDLTVTSLARQTAPGIAGDSMLGFVTEGQVFVAEADFNEKFFLNALPGAGAISHIFRMQDATHNWRVDINSAGDLDLVEDDAGDTTRINAAGVLSGGEQITVRAHGTTIDLYYDDTLAGTYLSASNFATETDGEWNSMGTAGLVSNHIIWPWELAGQANTILNRVSA